MTADTRRATKRNLTLRTYAIIQVRDRHAARSVNLTIPFVYTAISSAEHDGEVLIDVVVNVVVRTAAFFTWSHFVSLLHDGAHLLRHYRPSLVLRAGIS